MTKLKKDKQDPRFPPYEGEIRQLYEHLGHLVSVYHCDFINRPNTIREYEQTMMRMYDLGWDDILDWESELPDDAMPIEYIRRVGSSEWEYHPKNLPPPQRTFWQRLRDCISGPTKP